MTIDRRTVRRRGISRHILAAIAAPAVLGAGVLAPSAQTAPEATFTRVELPKDYAKTFKRYDMVDKVDRKIVRFLYVNTEALANIRPGEPMPSGTVIVMEDHAVALEAGGAPMKDKDGRLMPTGRVTGIGIMEKRTGWGETNLFPADKDNGDWEYASFKADGSANPIKLDNCYACHLPLKDKDFLFSAAKLVEAAKR